MNGAAATPGPHRHRLWPKLLAGFIALLVALVLLVLFFPWDWLRGPLNRYVSDKTGRHFEITRSLDVKLGRTTTILADGIEFANPDWARDPFLVRAQAAKIDIELLPLLRRQVVLPRIVLNKPQLGLQWEADGRRSWALGRDTADKGNLPVIGALIVDEGQAHFVAPHEGADIRTDFAIAESAAAGTASSAMPLTFTAKGTWQRESFSAQGRTGNVLHLSAPLQNPFPAEIRASSGRTLLSASGQVASLATLEGANARFQIEGQNLADLYRLTGMVLPETPRYTLAGNLSKQADVWHLRNINGKLGNSDLAGNLDFDRREPVPVLSGQLQSRALDFDDLAPLVGLPEQARSAAALPKVAGAGAAPVRTAARPSPTGRKVLPTATLDLERLKAMNADVKYSAARITNVRQLPLDRASLHINLKNGVLQLDPMNLGVAGGTFAGRLRIDGNRNPAMAEVKLDGRSLELNRLFPGIKLAQANFGKLHGKIDLKGPGNSVAQMLANSSGDVALLMGRGQISNLMLEIAGLDGGEIIKFFLRGDQNVQVRCAATAFDVNKGLMTARALVLDTADTVIYGEGGISLATETIDLTLRPYPKDSSILSLRSPLKVAGPFVKPKAGVETGALAGRAGIALALGAVNPLLALAATIETGPGRDADCGTVLREAASPEAAARIRATAPPPPGGTGILGGPGKAQRPPARGREGAHYPLEAPAR